MDQLNHYLTQALVCGARMPLSAEKELLQDFGLIHFLVISGAHVQFLFSFFKKADLVINLKTNQHIVLKKILFCLKGLSVFFLCLSTALSAPVVRASLHALMRYLTKKFMNRRLSRGLESVIIFTLLLPFAFYTKQSTSLLLSTLFSLICRLSFFKNSFKTSLFIYSLSIPIFLSLFKTPSLLSIILNPFFSLFTAAALLPFSFLSLLSKKVELLNIHLWWTLIDFLYFIKIYFNLVNEENSISYFKPFFSAYFLFIIITLELFIRPLWIRRSYVF